MPMQYVQRNAYKTGIDHFVGRYERSEARQQALCRDKNRTTVQS